MFDLFDGYVICKIDFVNVEWFFCGGCCICIEWCVFDVKKVRLLLVGRDGDEWR